MLTRMSGFVAKRWLSHETECCRKVCAKAPAILNKIALVCGLVASAFLPDHSRAADLDYAPCSSEGQSIPSPPMAFRPAGRPPGYVFFAPNNGRCLPGFFWRVYPDGNGECWPKQDETRCERLNSNQLKGHT
jgi:hypothetical protein